MEPKYDQRRNTIYHEDLKINTAASPSFFVNNGLFLPPRSLTANSRFYKHTLTTSTEANELGMSLQVFKKHTWKPIPESLKGDATTHCCAPRRSLSMKKRQNRCKSAQIVRQNQSKTTFKICRPASVPIYARNISYNDQSDQSEVKSDTNRHSEHAFAGQSKKCTEDCGEDLDIIDDHDDTESDTDSVFGACSVQSDKTFLTPTLGAENICHAADPILRQVVATHNKSTTNDANRQNADTVVQESFKFYPLHPKLLNYLDLRDLVMRNKDWRDQVEGNPDSLNDIDVLFLDKAMHLQKLTIETERAEKRLKANIRKSSAVSRNTIASKNRVSEATPPEKNCCNLCLQIVCAGNCQVESDTDIPNATNRLTRQVSTSKGITGYEQFERVEPPKESRPQVAPPCNTCRKDDGKLRPNSGVCRLNANALVQGRPHPHLSTYSSGERLSKRPTDYRRLAASDGCTHTMSKKFEKLGIEPVTLPKKSRATSALPRGRHAIMPHKAYHSVRKISLTHRDG